MRAYTYAAHDATHAQAAADHVFIQTERHGRRYRNLTLGSVVESPAVTYAFYNTKPKSRVAITYANGQTVTNFEVDGLSTI